MSTTAAAPAEQINVLHGVAWETYERLLADRGDDRWPRLTFDRGVLEIMSPGILHESLANLVTLLVGVLTEEWDLAVAGFGTSTFKNAGWERGFEPDACFYVGEVAEVLFRSPEQLVPGVGPAPDILVEIDISRRSIHKLALFAQFGAGEVWRHDGERMAIVVLDGDRYVPAEASRAFPALTADALTQLLDRHRATTPAGWLREVRAWAREHPPAAG